MRQVILFDLGNTLVSYYTRSEWPAVLEQAIAEVTEYLRGRGLVKVNVEELPERVQAERGERDDLRVAPLAERLARIFNLPEVDLEACRCFMNPLFARARVYDDTLPTLKELRRRGFRTGILSNTPWGSPAGLWREELDRHGLLNAMDAVVFCDDVGWRKPDPRPFEFICRKLDVSPGDCLFVGDDPRWDIVGPRGVGMDAILIDRTGAAEATAGDVIRTLAELLDR
ncbi:MAG TPA: HAD family hydrolase [Planctomycetota bacterium]|nr:HAD family hydrolase [Planctomycetota bacterium]